MLAPALLSLTFPCSSSFSDNGVLFHHFHHCHHCLPCWQEVNKRSNCCHIFACKSRHWRIDLHRPTACGFHHVNHSLVALKLTQWDNLLNSGCDNNPRTTFFFSTFKFSQCLWLPLMLQESVAGNLVTTWIHFWTPMTQMTKRKPSAFWTFGESKCEKCNSSATGPRLWKQRKKTHHQNPTVQLTTANWHFCCC